MVNSGPDTESALSDMAGKVNWGRGTEFAISDMAGKVNWGPDTESALSGMVGRENLDRDRGFGLSRNGTMPTWKWAILTPTMTLALHSGPS